MRLDGADPQAIERAADLLAAGELVAFPTETVYGLGARADDPAAVLKIFRAKGRPENHPLIVHVAEPAQIAPFAAEVPALAQRLIDAFWPGPLTLILPRLSGMGAAAAGHQNSIGLRCPSHPVARALLAAAHARGVPGVAAPSANRFGRVSPTRAAHVVDEFGTDLTVLDGGDSEVGIESGIVDCSRGHPVLLRPGVLSRARIEAVAGEPLRAPDVDAPRAPGTLAAHYAPNAKLRLMPSAMLHTALQVLGDPSLKLAVYSRGTLPAATRWVRHRRMPSLPEHAAHELFSVLRELDAEGVQLIWVEEPPPQPEWDGVRDRLARAAAA
ncbi:MAG: L-threonylcarbamoyladenylate synthase [Pseudomonadota bacterium]